ncbi:MAG: hypothetical protein H7641_00985 [Candidatus Heimdallarchaeota archaeon]|nr:hypothetical protein [Candidatus Heimdallarchaeota archaeon]MCK4876141.1 hypothetical protein [Candidatus Heimdallarchaeota archaeon]
MQQEVYFIISNLIGAVGIIGAIVAYLIAKRKIDSGRLTEEQEETGLLALLKIKMKSKLNLSLIIAYIVIMLFTIIALPFIVNPTDLQKAWILVGLVGILGLGTPYTFITLIVIFRSEIVGMKTIYPEGEPLLGWFNFSLLLLALSLPLVCMALMLVLRNEIADMKLWKKIFLSLFLVSILSMWIFLSIWSYQV